MMERIECPTCGIRYARDLDVCPWCGALNPESEAARTSAPLPDEPAADDVDDTVREIEAVAAPPTDAGDEEPLDDADGGEGAGAAAAAIAAVDREDADETVSPEEDEAAPDDDATPTAAEDEDGDEEPSDEAIPPPPPLDAAAAEPAPPPDEAAATLVVKPAVVVAAETPELGGTAPPRPSRWRTVAVYTLAIIALLVLGALIAEYAPIRSGSSDTSATSSSVVESAPVIPETTTTLPDTTTTTTAPETTATTEADTTTTLPETTTTTLPPLDPIGDPIPIDELTMGANGIGELEFGDDGLEVVGRLVASLGQPDADTGVATSTGEFGTCDGDLARMVRFGSLAVTNLVGDDGGETFAGYRLDLGYQEEPSPADEMATLSGLRAGDTVATLNDIYADFDVGFVEDGSETFFELRGNGDGLLLYGPVTSADDDGLVRGIYAPDLCDRA